MSSIEEKVKSELLKKLPIPPDKCRLERSDYYQHYNDNLFSALGPAALKAYEQASGGETKEHPNKNAGKPDPPPMASIISSSALTFNLLGDGPVSIPVAREIPCGKRLPMEIPAGTYNVIYEKQMYTLNTKSQPANLDAFLYNEEKKTAIFCEMKMLEFLRSSRSLSVTYRDQCKQYFDPEHAFCVFRHLIDQLKTPAKPDQNKEGLISRYRKYDAWQMLKHTLAIYNYTSLVTRDSVNACQSGGRDMKSMAGKFDNIILLNVVNAFPREWFADETIEQAYRDRVRQEKSEAEEFRELLMDQNDELRRLFEHNCHARFEIAYMSAKDFADLFDMADDRRDYLKKRYFG